MKGILVPAALAATLALAGAPQAAWAAGTYHDRGGGGGAAMDRDAAGRAAISVNGENVMSVASAGDYSAEERANLVKDRLRSALEPRPGAEFRPVSDADVSIVTRNKLPVLRVRDVDLLTVTHADARELRMSPQAVASLWATELRGALADFTLSAGQQLPEDFVIVSVGGGAGMAPGTRHKDKEKGQMKDKDKPTGTY